jgi:Uncharacterised nucleotidyltransferase
VPGSSAEFLAITESMKRSAAALREAGIHFALGGSFAIWARGGPETVHDLDLVVRPDDADAALAALEGAGMTPEKPPEGWLYKAWDGDVLVDLIWVLSGIEDVEQVLDRARPLRVQSVPLDVLALEDLLVSKVLALDAHNLDLAPLLRIARSVREQVDWPEVRRRTEHYPYSAAIFALLEALDVVTPGAGGGTPGGRPVLRKAGPLGGASGG